MYLSESGRRWAILCKGLPLACAGFEAALLSGVALHWASEGPGWRAGHVVKEAGSGMCLE